MSPLYVSSNPCAANPCAVKIIQATEKKKYSFVAANVRIMITDTKMHETLLFCPFQTFLG